MQPLMKCNVCNEVVEPIDVPYHEKDTGHNDWRMIKRKDGNSDTRNYQAVEES